jgi:TonB family protein
MGAAAAGLVIAELTVDAEGGVSRVHLIRDVEPFGSLLRDSAALWRFEPARDEGKAVEAPVLVAGFFRPSMLLFPGTEAPRPPPPPEPRGPHSMPYPTSVRVPPYPANVLGEGVVELEVDVDDGGAVREARILGGPPAFEDAALTAARGWRFLSARRDGRAVASRAYLVFSFPTPVTPTSPSPHGPRGRREEIRGDQDSR